MEKPTKEELSSIIGLLSREVPQKNSEVIEYSFEITNKETREIHYLMSKNNNISILLMNLYSRWKEHNDLNLFELEMIYAHMGLSFNKFYSFLVAPVILYKQ